MVLMDNRHELPLNKVVGHFLNAELFLGKKITDREIIRSHVITHHTHLSSVKDNRTLTRGAETSVATFYGGDHFLIRVPPDRHSSGVKKTVVYFFVRAQLPSQSSPGGFSW